MAVGAVEPQFFAQLPAGPGFERDEVPSRFELGRYDEIGEIVTARFANRTRDEWAAVFAGTDACVTPVPTGGEAADDEHLRARQTLIEVDGVVQAAPAPRFSRTPASAPGPPPCGITKLDEIDW